MRELQNLNWVPEYAEALVGLFLYGEQTMPTCWVKSTITLFTQTQLNSSFIIQMTNHNCIYMTRKKN